MNRNVFMLLIMLFLASDAFAESATTGYREITKLYVSGDKALFFLDESCSLGKPYYLLVSGRVDVDRFYATVMAAFFAGKRVDVRWEPNGAYCEVTRLFVK